QQKPAGVSLVNEFSQPFGESMRFRQVFAIRAFAFVKIGDRVEPETVNPHVEPERDDVEDGLLDLGVVVVEVGLMAEEAMPVELARPLIPGPVRPLGVEKNYPRAGVFHVRLAPDIPVALRRIDRAARFAKPRMLIGSV